MTDELRMPLEGYNDKSGAILPFGVMLDTTRLVLFPIRGLPVAVTLTNDITAGSPNPQSGTVYTVRHSPKTIVVTGGDVSQITINGVDTSLTAGAFKLGIGETIAVTYDTLVPTAGFSGPRVDSC